jgi:HEAT repeat protein
MALLWIALAGTLALQDPEELIEKLGSDRIEVREEASRRLIELGEAAAPALKTLARDPDAEKAARARLLLDHLAVLASLSPEYRKARPGIERRLSTAADHSWTEEFLAAAGRGRPPLWNQDLAVLVTRALRGAQSADESDAILNHVGWRKLRVPGPLLLELFERPETSSSAAFAISRVGTAEAVRDVVRRIDRNPQRHYHPGTLRVLLDADPAIVVPELMTLLDREGSRGRATWMLGELKAREAVPRIRTFASDRSTELRRCAAFALGNIGDAAGVPELLALFEDHDVNVRLVATQALVKLKAKEAVPGLIRLLEDPEAGGRAEAVRGLGEIGAREAVPELLRILKADRSLGLRQLAATSLSQLGAREALPEIVALLDSGDPTTIRCALEALRVLGTEEVVPDIARRLGRFKTLESDHDGILGTAGAAIAELTSRKGAPALCSLLSDDSRDVRLAAARLLCEKGLRDGVPTLLRDGGDLSCLNLLREPDLDKRLDRPFLDDGRGFEADDLKELADSAGLIFDTSAAPELATGVYSFRGGRSVRSLLLPLLRFPEEYDYILEKDRLRILPRAAALAEWKAWWAAVEKK